MLLHYTMSHRDTNYTTFTIYVSYQSILNTLVTFCDKFFIAYTGDVSVDSFLRSQWHRLAETALYMSALTHLWDDPLTPEGGGGGGQSRKEIMNFKIILYTFSGIILSISLVWSGRLGGKEPINFAQIKKNWAV
jgi:hypothetical protein